MNQVTAELHRLKQQNQIMLKSLEAIAKADPGEGGCFYTNRFNINEAKRALSAVRKTHEPTANDDPAVVVDLHMR